MKTTEEARALYNEARRLLDNRDRDGLIRLALKASETFMRAVAEQLAEKGGAPEGRAKEILCPYCGSREFEMRGTRRTYHPLDEDLEPDTWNEGDIEMDMDDRENEVIYCTWCEHRWHADRLLKGEGLMSTDPEFWYRTGVQDREAGNDVPGVNPEDFHREIEDEAVAAICAAAYLSGFAGVNPMDEPKKATC